MKIWTYDSRFGIMANQLFYGHPTTLAAVCIFLISCIFLLYKKEKKNFIYVVMILLVLLSTLRLKAISASLIIAILIMYILLTKKKINIAKFLIFGVIAFIIAFDQINYYYFEIDGSARKQLTVKSFEIAEDYFPIGTGFGTYGSYMSTVNYSEVYYRYNLNEIYGLQKGKTWFAADTFWPMIIGQFGVIGLICYLLCIITLYKEIQKKYHKIQIYIYKQDYLFCISFDF